MDDSNVVNAVPYLNRYALLLTGNKADADDLVSMTILKGIEIIRFQNLHVEKPNPFLGRVMRNLFISQFCRKRRAEQQFDDAISSVYPRQDDVVYLSEVMTAASNLNHNEKRILAAHFEGKTPEQISKMYRGYKTSIYSVRKSIKQFQEKYA